MKTKLLIEQHFHGAFGIDFNTASVDDVLYLSEEILKYGIGGIFPTIVTDSVENTKRAISIIKEAANRQTSDMARILGIHLEGIFLNPEKKGIHNSKYFLPPTIENYKLIEDDFIKIVTLAPELIPSTDKLSHIGNKGLTKYFHDKNIKIQAGHCIGGDLTGCDGVTHLFNAMGGITHREKSTALSALVNDDIYTEIIADGIHTSDDTLKLVLKAKPLDKIILISDCLPCTALFPFGKDTATDFYEFTFADEKIYYNGLKATSEAGTLAGSTSLLPDIIKRLKQTKIANDNEITQLINTPYKYHNIDLNGFAEWDDEWNIRTVSLCNF